MHRIHDGAIFIADAHYPHHGESFLKLLHKLHKLPQPPQIFLMGDIFDLLFGYNDYIRIFVPEAIELIDAISQKTQLYYFEGNHDFCLDELFPYAHVFSYRRQPQIFTYGSKKVGLAHGDRFDVPLCYKLYTYWLRNPVTLTLLKPWQKSIIDTRLAKLSSKVICRDYPDFERKAKQIVTHYPGVDTIVEGHFHQGRIVGNYVSLPSLACQGQIAFAKEGKFIFIDWERWSM